MAPGLLKQKCLYVDLSLATPLEQVYEYPILNLIYCRTICARVIKFNPATPKTVKLKTCLVYSILLPLNQTSTLDFMIDRAQVNENHFFGSTKSFVNFDQSIFVNFVWRTK